MLKLIAVSILLTSCGFNKTDEALAKKIAEVDAAQIVADAKEAEAKNKTENSDAKPEIKKDPKEKSVEIAKEEAQANAQAPIEILKEPSSSVKENVEPSITKPMPKVLSTQNCILPHRDHRGTLKVENFDDLTRRFTVSFQKKLGGRYYDFVSEHKFSGEESPIADLEAYSRMTTNDLADLDINPNLPLFYIIRFSPNMDRKVTVLVGAYKDATYIKFGFEYAVCDPEE